MEFKIAYLFGSFWTGWRRWAGWLICISAIFLLGALRIETDAEYAFASLALLPVLVISWTEGKSSGLFVACLAVAVWAVAGHDAERQFSAPWVPWANAITRLATYSLVALLVAQIRQMFEREHKHATLDALTGLQNRRAFLEAGAREAGRSKRYSHPLAVIFLDLDDFKQLNDTLGHDAGDAALRVTASTLRAALRSSDHVTRLGGDEFAVLLPEIEYDATIEAGRKICDAVNSALRVFPPVRASIGVAWFPQADRTFPEMIKAADSLMYEVKTSGKGDMRQRRFASINELRCEI